MQAGVVCEVLGVGGRVVGGVLVDMVHVHNDQAGEVIKKVCEIAKVEVCEKKLFEFFFLASELLKKFRILFKSLLAEKFVVWVLFSSE